MHEDIKRFTEDGKLRDDADIVRIKDVMTRTVEDKMRVEGYVPVIDLDVNWTTWYIEKEKCYGFTISLYGIHVGEECKDGIAYSGGKLIRIR